jgi:hypothetical protein
MSHDVDLELDEDDVTLSFTAPGRIVNLFVRKKGTDEYQPCPSFTLRDWERMTAAVRENWRGEAPFPGQEALETPGPFPSTEVCVICNYMRHLQLHAFDSLTV